MQPFQSQAPPSAPYSGPAQFPTQAPPTQTQWGGGAVQPVRYHWFYLRPSERYWIPFSMVDSNRLEETFLRSGHDTSQEVSVGSTAIVGSCYCI